MNDGLRKKIEVVLEEARQQLEGIPHVRIDTVKAKLIEMGFSSREYPQDLPQLRKCVLMRRIHDVVPLCQTNDKLWICITLSAYGSGKPGEKIHARGEFDITGETPNGDWAELKLYSIMPDQVIARLPQAEERLIRAWQAVCAE